MSPNLSARDFFREGGEGGKRPWLVPSCVCGRAQETLNNKQG